MYVKIHRSAKGNRNSGSCSGLVNYLEKENKDIDQLRENGIDPGRAKEHFFNKERRDIQAEEVISKLDNNKKGLHKEDAKYYEIIVSPSQKELAHISNNPEKLKDYVNEKVMPQYAENFKRDVKAENLVYYAKVEYDRTYKHTDDEVKKGKAEIGDKKPGDNTHVHIIVSRKDTEQRMSLSPLANDRSEGKGKLNGKEVKKGFSRDDFKRSCEKEFDKQFGYTRSKEESYDYMYAQKKERDNPILSQENKHTQSRKLSFEVDRESLQQHRQKLENSKSIER